MSKRYWVFAVALVLIVAGVALWFSWNLFSAYKQNHSNERAAASQYQANAADHSPASCRPVMGESGLIDWLTCLANNVSTDGSIKQAEYDLKAQQDMSAWALGMLIATIWLTVITLLGVFFVWRTLKATQDMAKETTRIGEAQVRAYLAIKQIHLGFESGSKSPTVELAIENTGQSPAQDIEIIFQFSFFQNFVDFNDHPDIRTRIVRWWFDDIPGGQTITSNPSCLSDIQMQTDVLGGGMERLGGVHFDVAVYALDVFEKEITAFGHFVVSWGSSDIGRGMKNALNMSRVAPGNFMIEKLRPYRKGCEKDGQG